MLRVLDDRDVRTQRQILYWRLLAAASGQGDRAPNVEAMTAGVASLPFVLPRQGSTICVSMRSTGLSVIIGS